MIYKYDLIVVLGYNWNKLFESKCYKIFSAIIFNTKLFLGFGGIMLYQKKTFKHWVSKYIKWQLTIRHNPNLRRVSVSCVVRHCERLAKTVPTASPVTRVRSATGRAGSTTSSATRRWWYWSSSVLCVCINVLDVHRLCCRYIVTHDVGHLLHLL